MLPLLVRMTCTEGDSLEGVSVMVVGCEGCDGGSVMVVECEGVSVLVVECNDCEGGSVMLGG